MDYFKNLVETGVSMIIVSPMFSQLAAYSQSLGLSACEHQDVSVATRTRQCIGQQTRMVLIG